MKRCADSADPINSLRRERDLKRNESNTLLATPEPQRESAREDRIRTIAKLQREIAALPGKIEALHQPFNATSQELLIYVSAVRDVLSRVPVSPPRLRDVGLAIQQLPLFSRGLMAGFISMKDSYRDLRTLRFRLAELLSTRTHKEDADEGSNSSPTTTVSSPRALIGRWTSGRRESLRSLAGKAGISPNTLRKIRDEKFVHESKISAVAGIIGCRYEDLLPR